MAEAVVVKKKKKNFKRCAWCPAVFLASDKHVRCLKCLGEGHFLSGGSVCWTFTPRAFKDRQNRLQVLLLIEDLAAL